MKLEVGKRYVLRNGEVVGPLTDYGGGDFQFTDASVKDDFGRQFSWRIDGSERLDRRQSKHDIVSEYSDPDPSHDFQQPLRWVENCKPDKLGIWATQQPDGEYVYSIGAAYVDLYRRGTWCYLGPIPEILPPKKKVVERLFLGRLSSSTKDGVVKSTFIEHWHDDADPNLNPNADQWIRTDRTREREI